MSVVALGALVLMACYGRVSLGDAPDEHTAPLLTPEPEPKPAPAPATETPPEEPDVPEDSPTYVTGPLGFVVRGAVSYSGSAYPFDMCGHYTTEAETRTARGILLTSYANPCTRTSVPSGGRILRIDFTAEAGDTPGSGTYPITYGVNASAACAGIQTANGAGCSSVNGGDGGHATGTLELSTSDATGMEGTFELDFGSGVVTGRFVAPRCAEGASVCGIN